MRFQEGFVLFEPRCNMAYKIGHIMSDAEEYIMCMQAVFYSQKNKWLNYM